MYQHINMNGGMKYVILPCCVDIFVASSGLGGFFLFLVGEFFWGGFLVKFLRILFLHIKVHEIRPPLFSFYDRPILPLPLIQIQHNLNITVCLHKLLVDKILTWT